MILEFILPHCIIEHSDNIKDKILWKELFKSLHKILIDTKEINEADIKTRVMGHSNYYIGDGNPKNAFITLNIQLLDGRDDQFKKDLTQAALELLDQYFSNTLIELNTSITVQISDIHRYSYSKQVS